MRMEASGQVESGNFIVSLVLRFVLAVLRMPNGHIAVSSFLLVKVHSQSPSV